MPVKKPNSKELKRVENLSLTLQDRFYIENNEDMSIEDVARNLGKPMDIVLEYMQTLVKKEKRKRGKATFNSDSKKGYTAMTEASSSVVDDAHKKYITTEAINKAMVEGNHELARELKQRYDEQQRTTKETIRKKYDKFVHYIEPIDDEEEIY
jgi:hypothetical protein